MVIWKYKLEVSRRRIQEIEMPTNARLLHIDAVRVHAVRDDVFLWVLCDPEAPLKPRYFQLVETGKEVPDHYQKYIGTVLLFDGEYVAHFFEL